MPRAVQFQQGRFLFLFPGVSRIELLLDFHIVDSLDERHQTKLSKPASAL